MGDQAPAQSGPRAPSCPWRRRIDVAICTDGIRFLVDGRRVTVDEFETHLADLRSCARPEVLHAIAVSSDGITAAEYAEREGLKLSTASERLRKAWSLGALRRTPMTGNQYRYEVAR